MCFRGRGLRRREGQAPRPAHASRRRESQRPLDHRGPAQGAGVKLAALFGVEHGINNEFPPGETTTATPTRRPACPCARSTTQVRKPTKEQLRTSMHWWSTWDIGTRSHTFISAMKLAARRALKTAGLVVLDRPSPLGGLKVDGPAARRGARHQQLCRRLPRALRARPHDGRARAPRPRGAPARFAIPTPMRAPAHRRADARLDTRHALVRDRAELGAHLAPHAGFLRGDGLPDDRPRMRTAERFPPRRRRPICVSRALAPLGENRRLRKELRAQAARGAIPPRERAQPPHRPALHRALHRGRRLGGVAPGRAEFLAAEAHLQTRGQRIPSPPPR